MLVVGLNLSADEYALTSGDMAFTLRKIRNDNPSAVSLRGTCTPEEIVELRHLPKSVISLNLSELVISENTAGGEDVKVENILPPYTLFATNIRELNLPDGLTALGEAALAETPLEKLTMPSGVKEIGRRAFYNCKALTEVDMSKSEVTEIPDECFYGCKNLTTLDLPSGIKKVGNRALMNTALTSVSLPSVTNIGDFALAGIPVLGEIIIPKTVEIGEGAFYNTPLLNSISELPQNVPSLAFAGSGVLPEEAEINWEIINEGSFANTEVSTLIIGKDVREIGAHAFRNMKGLQTVDVTAKGADIPQLDPDAFSGVDVSEVLLNVVPESFEEWRAADGWKDFKFDETSKIDNITDQQTAVEVRGEDGMVRISSSVVPESVSIYSLSGIVLYQNTHCSAVMEAGPFAEKEVIVRVIAGDIVKIGTFIIR